VNGEGLLGLLILFGNKGKEKGDFQNFNEILRRTSECNFYSTYFFPFLFITHPGS